MLADDCSQDHAALPIRRRVLSNGSVHLVRQCLACGWQSQAIARASLTADEAEGALPYDEGLRDRLWRAAFEARSAERTRQQDERRRLYDEYRRSEAWRRKRQLVLKRAAGLCEGCGSAPATEVHHLTYAHIFGEYLFELVALCAACHRDYHEGGS
jgi:hypothetical protein